MSLVFVGRSTTFQPLNRFCLLFVVKWTFECKSGKKQNTITWKIVFFVVVVLRFWVASKSEELSWCLSKFFCKCWYFMMALTNDLFSHQVGQTLLDALIPRLQHFSILYVLFSISSLTASVLRSSGSSFWTFYRKWLFYWVLKLISSIFFLQTTV